MTKRFSFQPSDLDRASEQSLHQQLYERVRGAVRDGRLRSGTRIPSTRSLAVQLGVARGTVDTVYARLASEGYLTPSGNRGTIVTPGLRVRASPPLPAASVALARTLTEPWFPLQLGLPALDLFPSKPWTRVLARHARQLSSAGMVCPEPMGLMLLREALAAYLAVSRGITCIAEQIVVTHGYQDALNLACDLVTVSGDEVWVEDPGYGFSRRALQARELKIVPVPVDDEGLQVDYGLKHAHAARFAVVTPAHQFPLGTTLSTSRRRKLLQWAARSASWILEDDYDCEFHYSGYKPAALKALDADDRVFYAGSFSKSLLPSLRLGYIVLPRSLSKPARERQELHYRGVPTLEQLAIAEFMTEGHFARHLRRMRLHYKARRNALVSALKHQFGDEIELPLRAGGLHLLARFRDCDDDAGFAERALRLGLKPSPLSGQTMRHDAGRGLLMCFTNVPESKSEEIAVSLRHAAEFGPARQ
jgi:GntR family transcriptional regulator/MocR family aminotransferase